MHFDLISEDLDLSVLFLLWDDGYGRRTYVETHLSFFRFVLWLDKRLALTYELGKVADASIEVAPNKSYILDVGIKTVIMDGITYVV